MLKKKKLLLIIYRLGDIGSGRTMNRLFLEEGPSERRGIEITIAKNTYTNVFIFLIEIPKLLN